MKTVGILLAGGSGKRMKSGIPKQHMMLGGRPVLYYALMTFEKSFVDEIVLVVGKDEEDYIQKEYVEKYHCRKVKRIIPGGKERYHSVYNGLNAIADGDYYFIHDAARPFLTEEILLRAFEQVKEHGACAVGMPVKDTIKISDDNGFIEYTPNRSSVWMIQTPQVFEGSLIREAYHQLMEKETQLLDEGIVITDDAMVVETLMKKKVKLVEGSYTNMKITTPEDIAIAETICESQRE